ncbi:hypothetical protein LguiA_024930 [Lonicera macranthoides]
MGTRNEYLIIAITLALASSLAYVSDPDPLQDFCVAVNDSKFAVFVNGKFCQDPKIAKVDDFFFSGLQVPRNTSNPVGSTVTPVNVDHIPGLNTLGISLVRIDYGFNGLNPPHTHPRATEILFVLEGTLYVGFVTSNTNNRLFTKTLYSGDVFVFSEGVITIANAVFGSNPPISPDVLTKAFQVEKNVVDYLQAQFWWDNN